MARPDDPPARRWLFDAAHPAPPVGRRGARRPLPRRRGADARVVARARNALHGATRASARRGTRARRRDPQPPAGRERRRCVAARVRSLVGRRHRADVPGRSAAAHPRCGHGGPPHRRQARLRGLASARGRERLVVRQRFDVGAAVDGAHRAARRDCRGAGILFRRGSSGASASRSSAPRCGKRCGSSASSS